MNELMGTVYCATNELADKGSVVAFPANDDLQLDIDDEATDETLVATAKMGDDEAFETLVKRYRPRMFALALRHTRVREDAEDVYRLKRRPDKWVCRSRLSKLGCSTAERSYGNTLQM